MRRKRNVRTTAIVDLKEQLLLSAMLLLFLGLSATFPAENHAGEDALPPGSSDSGYVLYIPELYPPMAVDATLERTLSHLTGEAERNLDLLLANWERIVDTGCDILHDGLTHSDEAIGDRD